MKKSKFDIWFDQQYASNKDAENAGLFALEKAVSEAVRHLAALEARLWAACKYNDRKDAAYKAWLAAEGKQK